MTGLRNFFISNITDKLYISTGQNNFTEHRITGPGGGWEKYPESLS